jgi:mannose-6-phosphate isomerase-like protein (cupin superfamily)
MKNSPTSVRLTDLLAKIGDYWNPRVVGKLNGQHIKLAKIKGEFVWHHHDKEDELFLVLRGRLDIYLRDRVVVVREGEFFIVPRGVEHKPVADEETHILLFEPVGTVNTGNIRNERTREALEHLTRAARAPGQPAFARYIGIDYSGAEGAESSLKGLRIYEATPTMEPREVPRPQPSPRRYWSRKEIAQWLIDELRDGPPTLVGIDHAFSFPIKYFERYRLPRDWPAFLEDFQSHWPTDRDFTYVDFIRHGRRGNGLARAGVSRWRRVTEMRTRAKSVFHFDVPGSVAKATHAGLPWLLHVRRELAGRVHFWPFDGWDIPAGMSACVEVYPSLWSRDVPRQGRTPDQHDAYVVAQWMRDADQDGSLPGYLDPDLPVAERKVAGIEGWILGVL